MADLSPIVPTELKSRPIAPTLEVSPTTVVPQAGTAKGMSDAYMEAAISGDPNKMYQFAKSASGTDFEMPAMNAWRGMANRVNKFDEIINAVNKKGGFRTPEGNIEIANQWPKAQNEPSVIRAIAEHLLGNPNARYFVSEGMIIPKIVYDRAGTPLQQNWTESGVLKSVIDPTTNKEVSPAEYKQRGAGIASVTDTMPYVASKKITEFNTEEANKANHAANDLASASNELQQMHNNALAQMERIGMSKEGNQDLLSPQERAQLNSFATRTVSLGQNASQSALAMDQYTRGGGSSLSQEQKKVLSVSLAPMGMGFDASGNIVNKDGTHVDQSKLNSLQQSGAFSKDFEQSFTQSKQEAMANQILKKLSASDQQAYSNILDSLKRIEDKKIELAAKHGVNANLPFLVNPSMNGLTDQNARFQVQNYVGMFNAELTKDYADFRREMLKNYPAGTAPAPGEIEAAFTRTDKYLNKKAEQADILRSIMNQVNATRSTPETNISTESVGGMKGQSAVNATQPKLPAVPTNSPTQTLEGAIAPPIPGTARQSQGFKVLPNSNRKFTVKE